MKRIVLLLAVSLCLLASLSCGKKDEAAPGGAAAPAPEVKTTSPEIVSMALVNACVADADKAAADYNGKPFVVKELLVTIKGMDDMALDACGYDPATGLASTQSACRLVGQPLKSGPEFSFSVKFKDPKEKEGLVGSHSESPGGVATIVFQQRIAVEGTVKFAGSGSNVITVENARLVRKE